MSSEVEGVLPKRIVKVICSKCGGEMKIEEWGYYDWWLPRNNKKVDKIRDYPAPHRNRGHPCKCGEYWLSSDFLKLVIDNEREIVYKFYLWRN